MIRTEEQGAIRTIYMSAPEKRNALSREMLQRLQDALPSAQDARVVILRGDPAGGAFSSGFDIGRIDDDERKRGLDPIGECADAIETCPVPVIACIEGAAFGGAVEIALSCAFRIAEKGARFSMPPAKLGLVYSMSGLARFARVLPPGQLARLFLSGCVIDAAEARAVGLVDVVCTDAQSESARYAEQIAHNAPIAVRGLLAGIRALSSSTSTKEAERLRELSLGSRDLLEGVAAFSQRRPPVFRGE